MIFQQILSTYSLHFRFILLFKVAKLKYGGREKQNQIKKEEEQKKGADGDTSTADANYSGRVQSPCVCMIEGSWISIWVHLTNLMVFSVLAGAKYKRGDGQFIVGEISFLSDSDSR